MRKRGINGRRPPKLLLTASYRNKRLAVAPEYHRFLQPIRESRRGSTKGCGEVPSPTLLTSLLRKRCAGCRHDDIHLDTPIPPVAPLFHQPLPRIPELTSTAHFPRCRLRS